MADEQPRQKRARGSRGKLRKGGNVESVVVEETFSLILPKNTPEALVSELGKQQTNQAGSGCYVSATVHTNRFYGVLVEQSALKAASLLHFHNEASSLDLNRRMKMLQDSQQEKGDHGDAAAEETPEENQANGKVASDCSDVAMMPVDSSIPQGGQEISRQSEAGDSEAATLASDIPDVERKRPAVPAEEEPCLKRVKLEPSDVPANDVAESDLRTIQKFRYVDSGKSDLPGYRLLLATYANVEAASEDDAGKARLIQEACQGGGGFVGKYYYQYEVVGNVLETSTLSKKGDIGAMRMSLGFESFLHNTALPTWFPLRNLEMGQHRVLSMLKMKKGKGDSVVWDDNAKASEIDVTGTHIPMEPRSRYRVGILGAGIAGLACATELLAQAERDNVELEVVVLEARSRIGGRLQTDETTFKGADGETPFPVDLGASWIHGIDHNPLASLAKEAGVNFVTSSEEVKMLRENMGAVDSAVDDRIGDMFDDLLDQAAEDCWEQEDFVPEEERSQKAVRWYASGLGPGATQENATAALETDPPPHRSSSDVSLDHAIGRVIAKNSQKKFAKLSEAEQNLLMWNILNTNYALGANISDLSMKFWDVDEKHSFEGDHVLLREGYSRVVRHMLTALEKQGDRFKLILDFPIAKVEYARKSTTMPYHGKDNRHRKFVELSDTCSVTSRNADQILKFDFLVSTLPLGVLKQSINSESDKGGAVSFQPRLPFTKRDSIKNVGFGLLNKVYLQFPSAFWRVPSVLPDGQILFGNASGVNPEHYMFYDIGKSLGTEANSPAILMTLISGKEAVASEHLSDEALVNKVLQTLRVLFSHELVPEPIASKTTRWGGDEFSRGCYTFLPPGTSDQDFQILQSPINGNGDSLVLEGSETMRLFWAGEHTTSLHPSMAHGAMLSGIRAAREVVSTIQFRHLEGDAGTDKLVPLAIFRKRNPGMTLQCNLCNLYGSRAKEGSLLAFQRGARQVLAHNNCAENSPEVEVSDGKWKNVVKAINRAKHIECALCGQMGATVGCTHPNCFKSFHFSCGEETGWRFERDGKVFFCDMHRSNERKELDKAECDQVSARFFRSRYQSHPLLCQLCSVEGDHEQAGPLMIFQQRNKHILVHEKCARFTNVAETVVHNEETDEDTFRNLLEAVNLSKYCIKCNDFGATICCSDAACQSHFHYTCAEDSGWNFEKEGKRFRCAFHRGNNAGERPSIANAATTTNGTSIPPFAAVAALGATFSQISGATDAPTDQSDGTTNGEPVPFKFDEPNSNGGLALSTNGETASSSALEAPSIPSMNGTSAEESQADSSIFQHNLFCSGGSTVLNKNAKTSASLSQPSNAQSNGFLLPPKEKSTVANDMTIDLQESSDEESVSSDDDGEIDPMLQPLSADALPTAGLDIVAVSVDRASVVDPWNVSFGIVKGPTDFSALCIEVGKERPDGLEDGDIVSSINAARLGSAGAANLQEILSTLREATSLNIVVRRISKESGVPAVNEPHGITNTSEQVHETSAS